ncbi:Pyruvate kinase family protein [Euphorbia peplus]|nr:Pyruvate kinase family protein [Euphorbia peplus]
MSQSNGNWPVSMTKIVASLGSCNRSNDTSSCLQAGMSVVRFDFRRAKGNSQQKIVDTLRSAIKSTNMPCAVMMDTMGPELQGTNESGQPITLVEDAQLVLTPNQNLVASSNLLPINFNGLSKAVKPGDTIGVCQYMRSGSKAPSVWLEVSSINGDDVVCVVSNTCTLRGPLLTLHVLGIHLDLPAISDEDKEVISTWGVQNKIDILSLSHTRTAQDVREARQYLSKLEDLSHAQIFATIENAEGISNFDEILQEADGVILCRKNMSIYCLPELVLKFQKTALYKCNMAGKPAVVSNVVESMSYSATPTRAEGINLANAVLDGCDAILLDIETLLGPFPGKTISTVSKICAETEILFNRDLYSERIAEYVRQPVSNLECSASSAVQSAIEVNASAIICFTSSGRVARLIAKYKPTMPVLTVVLSQLETNQLKWNFEAQQLLIVRGLFPVLADLELSAKSTNETNELLLKDALNYGKSIGVVKPRDKVIVCQEDGDALEHPQ